MDDEKMPSLAERIRANRERREAHSSDLNLPNPEHEIDRVLGEQGDRQAQRRTQYRDDLAQQRETGRAERDQASREEMGQYRHSAERPADLTPAEHKAELVTPFQAFEIAHCVEHDYRNALDGKTYKIVERLEESPFATINDARNDREYKSDFWTIYGRNGDGTGQAIGDFKTEDMARDVLGGITGDRNYDQRPLTQTAEAALWHGFAQSIEDLPAERVSLADRINVNHSDAAEHITRARRTTDKAVWNELQDRLPPPSDQPEAEQYTRDQRLASAECYDRTKNRPNEQLLGQTRERW